MINTAPQSSNSENDREKYIKDINFNTYRKIPKISPGANIFQRPFLRGLSTEGNLRFKIDRASLIVGSKFTVFALFYFVFEGNFPRTSPRGTLYLEGRFNGWFFCVTCLGGLYLQGVIFGILWYFAH